jgi:hypothetical protein
MSRTSGTVLVLLFAAVLVAALAAAAGAQSTEPGPFNFGFDTSLSNLGRIAFVAQLEDGRTAIFVARPDLG